MKQADSVRFRVWISIASIVAAPVLAGCGLFGSPVPEGGRPVRDVYEEADGGAAPAPLHITPHPEPGAGPRSRPVIYPPQIFPAYVEEHVDGERDMMIGGHWIYFKLRDSSWTKERIDREPPTSIPFENDADLTPLRKAFTGQTLRRILVPYRADSSKRPSPEPEEGTSQWNSQFIREEGARR